MVMCVLGKDYREMEALLRDSIALRAFLEIEQVQSEGLPRFGILAEWVRKLPPGFLEQVNVAGLVQERGAKTLEMKLNTWRTDASCVESNIHHPTDSSLLRDAMRWMHRWLDRIRTELGVRCRMNETEIAYEQGQRIYLAIVKIRGVNEGHQRQRRKQYRKLLRYTQTLREHFCRHRTKAQEMGAFDQIEDVIRYARFRAMLEEWERLEPLLDRSMEQARQRVLRGKVVPNEDKLLSLWEDHTQVIVRGKENRPVEFGHKTTYWESAEGMLVSGGIYPKGNPSESSVLAEEMEKMHKAGFRLEAITIDRGYWSPETEKLAGTICGDSAARIYCPQKGKRSPNRRALERSKEFAAAQRFRVGIEGTLSVLMRRHGLRRARLKKWAGFERHVQMRMIGINLLRLVDYQKRQEWIAQAAEAAKAATGAPAG